MSTTGFVVVGLLSTGLSCLVGWLVFGAPIEHTIIPAGIGVTLGLALFHRGKGTPPADEGTDDTEEDEQ